MEKKRGYFPSSNDDPNEMLSPLTVIVLSLDGNIIVNEFALTDNYTTVSVSKGMGYVVIIKKGNQVFKKLLLT
ncbi:MAG: hypothetical protein R2795_22260 [Saprospiraceae bacterium]